MMLRGLRRLVWLPLCWSALGQAQDAAVITVRGSAPSAPGSLVVPGKMAAEGAGTQGDPVKVLQSLPGLGRGGIGGAELVMWGSQPSESLIRGDDVPVPRLYHGSGVRSILAPSLVASVRSEPGAYGPADGRALGGLVELETAPPDTGARHLRASADLLDVGVVASSPIAELGAGSAALRYGYVDRWLPALVAPELRGTYRVPSYWDARAEVASPEGRPRRTRLVAMASSDRSNVEILPADPARRQHALDAQSFGRLYLRYSAREAATQRTLTPFVGWDHSEQTLSVGSALSGVEATTLRYGLRATERASVASRVALSFGLDADGALAHVSRRGSLSIPRREGDPFPFGTPPGADVAVDDYRVHLLSVGVFAECELRAGAGLSLRPGLRFEPTLIETSRVRPPLGSLPDQGASRLESALEPRLAVEQRLSHRARLFAAVGRYHQPPSALDLSARFGNPMLGLGAATHASFGQSVVLASRTRIETVLFAKWLSQLPTRSAAESPELARVLVASGSGRVFGAQLFVRQAETKGFSGWLSLTLARSERRDADGALRLSDFDAPVVLALALLERLGTFRFGARARFSSGLPRTAVTGAYYDAAAQRYQPLLGPTNAVRLPSFFQLDLRVDRRFELSPGTSLELYLDALNVTFRRNAEELAYSSDFRNVGSITGLPPLAVVGIAVQK